VEGSYIYHRVDSDVKKSTMMFKNKGRTWITRRRVACMECVVTWFVALCATVRNLHKWDFGVGDNSSTIARNVVDLKLTAIGLQ
jgi:hypothetical protein